LATVWVAPDFTGAYIASDIRVKQLPTGYFVSTGGESTVGVFTATLAALVTVFHDLSKSLGSADSHRYNQRYSHYYID
jgi:hypothetical protein